MQTRLIIGSLLTVAGLAAYVAATAVLFQAINRQDADTAQIQRAETSCREQIVKLGRMTPRANDILELEIGDKDGLQDPRGALEDANAALAMCPGRNIVYSCLGTTCKGDVPGPITLILRLGVVK